MLEFINIAMLMRRRWKHLLTMEASSVVAAATGAGAVAGGVVVVVVTSDTFLFKNGKRILRIINDDEIVIETCPNI